MWSPGGTQGSPKHAWKNPWNVMIPGQHISTSAPLLRNFSVADSWLQHEVQHLNCTPVPPRPARSYLSISGPLLKDNTGRVWRSTLCSSKVDDLNYHPTQVFANSLLCMDPQPRPTTLNIRPAAFSFSSLGGGSCLVLHNSLCTPTYQIAVDGRISRILTKIHLARE